MLQVYYGMGRGKTSSLNGQAIRAHGANLKVIIYRFLKGRLSSENELLEKLGIDVVFVQKSSKFVFQMSEDEKNIELSLLKVAMNEILKKSQNYDVIILDEVIDLIATSVNFLTKEQLMEFLNAFNQEKEIIISGHEIFPELASKADLITYFEKQKHYFDKGISARKGFEF